MQLHFHRQIYQWRLKIWQVSNINWDSLPHYSLILVTHVVNYFSKCHIISLICSSGDTTTKQKQTLDGVGRKRCVFHVALMVGWQPSLELKFNSEVCVWTFKNGWYSSFSSVFSLLGFTYLEKTTSWPTPSTPTESLVGARQLTTIFKSNKHAVWFCLTSKERRPKEENNYQWKHCVHPGLKPKEL